MDSCSLAWSLTNQDKVPTNLPKNHPLRHLWRWKGWTFHVISNLLKHRLWEFQLAAGPSESATKSVALGASWESCAKFHRTDWWVDVNFQEPHASKSSYFYWGLCEIKLEIGHLLRTPGFLCQNARMPIQLIPRWSLVFVGWPGGKNFWWKKIFKKTFLWFRLDCFSAESLSCSAPDQCSSVEERQSCQCLDEHWRKAIWEQCQGTAKFQTTLCFGELGFFVSLDLFATFQQHFV